MKVVDQGQYYLLDAVGVVLAEIDDDYVPNCIPGEYGDYIRFKIGPDGAVEDWRDECTAESVRNSFFGSEDD